MCDSSGRCQLRIALHYGSGEVVCIVSAVEVEVDLVLRIGVVDVGLGG